MVFTVADIITADLKVKHLRMQPFPVVHHVTRSETGNESSSFGTQVHCKKETCLLLDVLETVKTTALILLLFRIVYKNIHRSECQTSTNMDIHPYKKKYDTVGWDFNMFSKRQRFCYCIAG